MLKKLLVISSVFAIASCSNLTSKDSGTSETKTAKPITAVQEQPASEKSANKHVVYFDTNSAKLTAEAVASLEKKGLPMVKEIAAETNSKIVIEGYCDERGSEAYNKKLGKKRAAAVKQYFVKHGVKASKIRVMSYGEAMPVDPGHTEEAWAKNRRAVTVSIKM